MGGVVESQLNQAMYALTHNDMAVAEQVRDTESRVNEYEKLIDQETVNIIALRQPAATDLRLLISLLKSSIDLERIGDEAKRIAKTAIQHPTLTQQNETAAVLDQMAIV